MPKTIEIYDSLNNRPPVTKEKNDGKSRVEKAGYVPAQKRIEELLNAGARLSAFRKEQYDSMDPNEDLEVDPTRDKGFDLAEGTQLGNALKPVVRAAKAALQRPRKTPPLGVTLPDASGSVTPPLPGVEPPPPKGA